MCNPRLLAHLIVPLALGSALVVFLSPNLIKMLRNASIDFISRKKNLWAWATSMSYVSFGEDIGVNEKEIFCLFCLDSLLSYHESLQYEEINGLWSAMQIKQKWIMRYFFNGTEDWLSRKSLEKLVDKILKRYLNVYIENSNETFFVHFQSWFYQESALLLLFSTLAISFSCTLKW